MRVGGGGNTTNSKTTKNQESRKTANQFHAFKTLANQSFCYDFVLPWIVQSKQLWIWTIRNS